jgi:hypothetical protein
MNKFNTHEYKNKHKNKQPTCTGFNTEILIAKMEANQKGEIQAETLQNPVKLEKTAKQLTFTNVSISKLRIEAKPKRLICSRIFLSKRDRFC